MTSVERLGIFFVIVLCTIAAKAIFSYIIDKKVLRIIRTKTEINGMIIGAIKNPIGYFILLQGFYIAIISLQLPEKIGQFDTAWIINTVNILIVSFILLYFVFRVIDIIGHYAYKNARRVGFDEQLSSLIIKILRVVTVVIWILTIVQNFGYSITTIVAGLGIGGLAFALAAQNTLGNLFGSVTILSDKPFRLGDCISVGEVEGIVEDVGFRSTQIRRFDQALVIVPNNQFVNKEIINYSSMKKRMIRFELGLAKDTSRFRIKDLVSGIKNIIENDQRFDKSYVVRFTDITEGSLNIFINCFTKTVIWEEYLAIKEDLNLEILSLVDNLGVKMVGIKVEDDKVQV